MKERPILFSTPMVQAIMDGRKTMTRRTKGLEQVSIIPFHWGMDKTPYQKDGKFYYELQTHVDDSCKYEIKCPYGQVGDILWVRETFRKAHGMPTGPRYEFKATALEDGVPIDEPWKPSIFMPREACRLFLEITNIRVDRLQDISEDDAINEGIEWKIKFPEDHPNLKYWKDYLFKDRFATGLMFGAKESFKSLWLSINGPESWTANPWVWVIKFKRIQP